MLFAVGVADGFMTVTGTAGNETIAISVDPDDAGPGDDIVRCGARLQARDLFAQSRVKVGTPLTRRPPLSR